MTSNRIKYLPLLIILFNSCSVKLAKSPFLFVKKAPPNKAFVVENKIKIIDANRFTKSEVSIITQRLLNQLEDSSKVTITDKLGFLHILKKPVAYDTVYSRLSASNMRGSMFHLGYYNAKVSFSEDTVGVKKKKVTVQYNVTAGNPTLIDTLSYRLKIPELQSIAVNSRDVAILSKTNQISKKQNPVTKTAVLAEISRLVDSFRNNGYYKFTAAELRVRGDSSIAALTNISDDPFEQLELLNEAQRKRDSPTVKLAIVIVKPEDTTKLNKYFINKVYVLSDFRPGDNFIKSRNLYEVKTKNLIIRYHQYLFKSSLLERSITLHSGDVYRQDEFYKTLNNLSKLGVWQSVNIRIVDNFDEPDKIDLIIELLPAKKFSNVNSLDLSYSTGNSKNALGGNLFGISLNFLLENRNLGKEAIKMTHNLRGGIELNNKNRTNTNNIINSNEISYSNNVTVPKLLLPKRLIPTYFFPKLFLSKKTREKFRIKTGESFINTSLSYNNRLELFNLQSANISLGYSFINKNNNKLTFRPINVEYNYLYNRTDSFNNILLKNPFLNYSYNTSLVLGMAANYSSIKKYTNQSNSNVRVRVFKVNAEESGLTWSSINVLKDIKRKYLKLDLEFKNTITYKKSELALRVFGGFGLPQRGDSALPFFKQFYGGGSNSMRGWPIRGIGRGSQKLIPFITGQSTFNDRTGDMQLEANIEYRHDITPIFSWLKLKGALFADFGNIWNIRNSNPTGSLDETQFKLKNIGKEIGMSAGYGLRLDFTYLIARFDFGFRFKRPETSYLNNGWKAPDVSFDDIFQKILSKNYRQWRYENFNFSLGINYPF
jgi:outer membrane protein insertion porin family